ncbi:NUDIX hydrolase [Streptomyces sp. URMC 123]|uniref:NUDIX hydrolase n=1 Tax=Streptomyces sp. URMC 123 TaxID=3423403 RepID=UPI003F1DB51C
MTAGGNGTVVRAAGCVLWRRPPHGAPEPQGAPPGGEPIEIGLVHRPKYGDWSHPKGKLKRDEEALAGAVREVLEETGMDCLPGAVLPTVRYEAGGRPKEVRYWAAEAVGGTFVPGREVDRLLWLPPAAAKDVLTHARDRDLVDALVRALPEH